MVLLRGLKRTRIKQIRWVGILLVLIAYFSFLELKIPLTPEGSSAQATFLGASTASADSKVSPDEQREMKKEAVVIRPRFFINNNDYQPSWTTLPLDQSIQMELLDESFTLKQTQNHLGTEYFSYAGYLFSQIANQTNDPEATVALQNLVKSTHELKTYMNNSGKTWFDGTPTANMDHLQIRSYIMGNLNQLNASAIHRTDYYSNGSFQDYSTNNQQKKPGPSLQRFQESFKTVRQTRFMQNHPETMALIKKQVALLDALAMNLELRWESRLVSKNPQAKVTRMRIFAEQTLLIEPEYMVTATSPFMATQ